MPDDLYVFGSNGEGQLGEGIPAADIVNKPTKLPRLDLFNHIKGIKSGDNHTVFHLTDDSASGIGDNRVGQITGIPGSQVIRYEKIQESVSFVAAACESTAVISYDKESDSSFFTRGRGQWGELGQGDEQDTQEKNQNELWPLKDRLPGEVIDLAAGVWHYVAILADGSVYGWGKGRLGQLGDKLSTKISKPTRIDNLPFKPAKVVCGKDFTYLASTTGEHKILGKDKFGIISNMPLDIQGWKDIGATWHAVFVLFENGCLAAWGKENQWKLLPPDLPPIDKIAVGTDHILAVTKEDKLISWGWGKHGNCGDLANVSHEIKDDMVSGFWNEIDIPGRITRIAAGYCTSFVVTEVSD